MTKGKILIVVVLSLFVISAVSCGGGGDGGGVVKTVTVTDPADAPGNNADMTSATIEQVGDNLKISVTFAPGEFDSQVSYSDVTVDIDMNPNTGFHTDSGLMGVEYIVEMGGTCLGGNANILRYNSTTTNWDTVGTAAVTFRQDGMEVTFPLSMLEGYTGAFSFWFESARQHEGTCTYTGRLDSMPDMGTPPGVFQ